MKADIAVQSYKKPESLLYALMSLKKYSDESMGDIFINDDSEVPIEELNKIFLNDKIKEYFKGHKIFVRKNTKRMAWFSYYIKGYFPRALNFAEKIKVFLKRILRRNEVSAREDVRYQYAIDHAQTDYVYVIHDDMQFHDDVLGLYLKTAYEGGGYDLVGDLGQCWRCYYENKCNPQKIANGIYPCKKYPVLPVCKKGTENQKSLNKYACRINEWSALVNVKTEKEIAKKYKIFFGHYYSTADVGAYYYKVLVEKSYKVTDPLPSLDLRKKYYTHMWFGKSGHSVWVDQGTGKVAYQGEYIRKKIYEDFGIEI